ncbi:MAG: hypothetical protein U1B78_05355, partial [Dehalococcoidia bacterium]|nr:hypothetical protein [Dehalococcoidia bacterium]
MLYRSIPMFVTVALLAAACGGGGDDVRYETQSHPKATAAPATEPAGPPASAPNELSGEELFESLDPFALLNDAGSGAAPGAAPANADELQAALLDVSDLPSEFRQFEDIASGTPSPYGDIEMVGRMFATGDPDSDDPGTLVMSMIMTLPPEALAELGDPSDFSSLADSYLEGFTSADALLSGLGNVEFLDASGLGDGGIAMRTELDISELFGGLGELGTPEGSGGLPPT